MVVTAPCLEQKAACVMDVHFAVMEDTHVDIVCDCTVRCGCSPIQGRWVWTLYAVACTCRLFLDVLRVRDGGGIACPLWFCARGLRPLAFLDHVALDCLVRGGAKAFYIG